MEHEEKVNLLVSLGLFPCCGHHRVIASKELAEEDPENEWMLIWSGVKVICPPEGRRWENSVRILGYYDNLQFGTRLSFAEQMAWLRREYVDKYMREDGDGYIDPVVHKKAFRKKIAAVLQSSHAQTVQSAEGLLVRPPALYSLVRRILNGEVDHPEIPFSALGGSTSLHFLATMPNDVFEGLLKDIISRENTCTEANMRAKKGRALAFAREHIARTLKKKFPLETKNLKDWDHFTEKWPRFEELADKAEGYWTNHRGKAKERILPFLDEAIEAQFIAYRGKAQGKVSSVVGDRKKIPFLSAPQTEEKVHVLRFQHLHFVLLNCSTEAASKWLEPHEYGQCALLSFSLLRCFDYSFVCL